MHSPPRTATRPSRARTKSGWSLCFSLLRLGCFSPRSTQPHALRTALCFALCFHLNPSNQASADPAVVPPRLLYAGDPQAPNQASDQASPDRAPCQEQQVELLLTIDTVGRVTQATPASPGVPELDAAAEHAAQSFVFTPAQRGGEAIAARVRYAYRFICPQAEPQVVAAPVASAEPQRAVAESPEQTPSSSEVSTLSSSRLEPSQSAPTVETEITVYGAPTAAQRLQRSAEAVTVVDLSKARKRSADLGEVLARSQGVTLRRDGGLGSSTRLSLNGLSDNQVRLFLDGVPLDVAGYPLGIANVPVNLIERVEVFRGVVPLRFGADALGGAVNLVSSPRLDTHLGLSYQVGSFGTYRLTAEGTYHHDASGFLVRAAGFWDHANNDYPTRVSVSAGRGRVETATVERTHDAYAARGVHLSAGFVQRSWAKQLMLTAFLADYDKELPGNPIMTVPYGEVRYGGFTRGATLRYDLEFSSSLSLGVVFNLARRDVTFVDNSAWIYDWFGRRTAARRFGNGEIGGDPTDQVTWQDSIFARASLEWSPASHHTLRLASTPQYAFRHGKQNLERTLPGRDPLAARNHLVKLVTGLEYELRAFDEAMQNLLFAKHYLYSAVGQAPQPGGKFRRQESNTQTHGIGDALRVRIAPWLLAKGSYEFTTRLPETDETFGDGVLVGPNLELAPESSHNFNLGPRIEVERSWLGGFTLDLNAFLRDSKDLIVLLGDDRAFQYKNVLAARALGVEGALSYQSPHRLFGCEGSFTTQDVRNRASAGTFATYRGDRIPNRPYLFGSWGAHLRFAGLPGAHDTLEPFYLGRYTHSFFRGWESQGLTQFKQTIDAQVTHSAGVSWSINRPTARITSTLQVDNLTDALVFDNYGSQRPGRAVYLKLSGEI